MKILIIEDEPLAAERLQILLASYDASIEVLAVLDSVFSAKQWLETRLLPDLILLDIELADGRCFPLLGSISPDCPVIFTTAYDQFALDAFQHLSVDYLLKPVTATSLARALNRYKSMRTGQQEIYQSRYKKRFLVKIGTRMSFIETSEVSYFFADGKNVFLVHRDGMKYPIDVTIDKLESSLDPAYFFRFSRKIIGSVGAIRDIRTFINSRLRISLHAGQSMDEAIVSRERVQAFKQWANAQ
jgi:DNA-binding LytR/AlgR family response regulator